MRIVFPNVFQWAVYRCEYTYRPIYSNLQSLLQAFGCDNESRNVDVILSISSQSLSPYMVPTESAVCIRFSCGLDFGICNPLFLTPLPQLARTVICDLHHALNPLQTILQYPVPTL